MDKDVQSTHKQLCNLKRAQLGYDKKITNLEAILKKVMDAKSKLTKARTALLDKPLRKAADAYSQSWNLKLASEIRSRLPREIRDLIYEQVWTIRDTVQAYQLTRLVRGQEECPGRPCTCLRDRAYPHILNPAFVGAEIALEAVESFYKYLPAYMSELEDPSHIKAFLYTDALHLGFQPVTAVRSMGIICRTDYYINYDPKSWDAAPIKNKADLEASFKLLLNIVIKRGFKLRVLISQRVIRLLILNEFLEIIKPILLKLRDEGVKVELAFAYRQDKHCPEYSDLEWSMNSALDQPLEAWKPQLIEYLDEHEEEIKPRHREYRNEGESYYSVNEYFLETFMPPPTASEPYTDSEDSEEEEEEEEEDEEMYMEDYDDEDSLYGSFGLGARPPAALMAALFGDADDDMEDS
ncbi:hypothetical protein P154DRAFT_526490 [Amniculicola lignicola CBS 123094]|uniref:Uncharacterized protein n=1 Tax=Amniculicola lignicola CBS 123094 TaxID=1392246 RepID=A0A6A5W855_9PLEO|nr:hypothetical protein P154DRAFT_526490 [Amniculicola lignicola CBS 123094]